MAARQVRALLMGGQACVFYGAAEFSRDTDLLILLEPANLERFSAALIDLRAELIAVPPFEAEYLARGHAIRFRCHNPEAEGIRVDIMSKLRGVAARIAPELARSFAQGRPLLVATISEDARKLEEGLMDEERAEREEDRKYWLPLKAELERIRHARKPQSPDAE